MSVLKSTLQQLADHKTAVERYLIVLAMEVAEDGHEAKAQKLSEEFKGRCACAAILPDESTWLLCSTIVLSSRDSRSSCVELGVMYKPSC